MSALQERLDEARAILGAADGQPLAVRAQDLMVELSYLREELKGAPTQVFRPRISATVHTGSNGKPYATFEIGALSDPAFFEMPVERLGRLVIGVMERP